MYSRNALNSNAYRVARLRALPRDHTLYRDNLSRIIDMHHDHLYLWKLDENFGRVAKEFTGKTVNVDLMFNGGFESAGSGGADVFKNWTEGTGDGTIIDEGTIVHSGSHACKLTAGPTFNTNVAAIDNSAAGYFYTRVNPGTALTLAFWTRGDGVNAGRYRVGDITHGVYLQPIISTGVTGTTYTRVTFAFTIPTDCVDLLIQFFCPPVNGGIAYYDDVSLTGYMTLDGVYAPSGITLQQPGPDGHYSVYGNGDHSHILIGSKAHNATWNGDVGSAIVWGKVDSLDRWYDSTTHRYLYHPKSTTSANVFIAMGRSLNAHHRLWWMRRVNVIVYEVNYDFLPVGTLNWFCMGMTWDVLSTPKRIACYLYTLEDNTFRKISDAAPTTGNERWIKTTWPTDGGNCDFMAGTGLTGQEWMGYKSITAQWLGIALTDAEMESVMVPGLRVQ